MDHPHQSNHGAGNNRPADPPRNSAAETLETPGRLSGVLELRHDGHLVDATDDLGPAAVPVAEGAGVEEYRAGREVMASLPRRRPQRRSSRRPAPLPQRSSTPAPGSRPAAVSGQEAEIRRGLRLLPPDPPTAGAALRAARRRARLEHDLQGPAGFAQLAVDGVVEAAKLPIRAGAQMTSIALEVIARGIGR